MARKTNEGPKTFTYEAISPQGERIKGKQAKMTAYSADAVRKQLGSQGYVVIDVKESGSGLSIDLSELGGRGPLKLDAGELAQFARQLHNLLNAGISIPATLMAIGEDAKDPRFTQMCLEMANAVQSGTPLSAAMADQEPTFDEVFVAYITSGEATGSLPATTERLAQMMAKKAELRLKIKGVTAYPKMVAYVIGVLVLGILMFLVPNFADIYADFGAELPAPTQALVTVSNQMLPLSAELPLRDNIPILGRLIPNPLTIRPNLLSPLIWGVALIFGVKAWLKATADNDEIGIKLDKAKFRMPVFGELNRRLVLFRWTSTLSGALASGVQTTESLELAARASGSRWIKAVTPALVDAIRSGRPLSTELLAYPDLFPPNIRTMVTTGEKSGEMAEMLESVAAAVDNEIDAIIAGLGAKIEVALLMILGGVVGGLLVVLYLPILSLTTTVGESYEK